MSDRPDPDVNEWKRRERALGAGICVWALGVSILATVSPDAVASWLQSTEPHIIAGVLMATIGFCGGIVEHGLAAASTWTEPENAELLRWDDAE